MGARMQPIPFIAGSYDDKSQPFSGQVNVNYLYERAENGQERSQDRLRTPPGHVKVATLSNAGVEGAGRGLHVVNGALYAVSGNQLYSVNTDYTYSALGTINGSHRVSMSHNQVDGGNQLTIVNGPEGWVYDTSQSSFAQITDPGFTGSSATGFIGGYTAQLDPLGLNWYVSDIADSKTYNPVNTFQAEADPDKILTILVDHLQVWAFGAQTVEQFVATGTLPILFQSQQGSVMEIGIGGKNTAVAIDNTIYFLGSDGIVYNVGSGYVPVRVSNFGVEEDIRNCNWSQAYAFAWTDNGHKVYYLTFPDGHTWGLDISQREWHRRESYGIDFWRLANLVYWNNAWYGQDFQNGNLYKLDWNVFTEDGQPMVSSRVGGPVSNSQNRATMSAFELYMDLGTGQFVPDGYVEMRYSDDGGRTWSNWKEESIDDIRNRDCRCRFVQLGSFRNRMIEVRTSGSCKRDIIAAYAQMKGSI